MASEPIEGRININEDTELGSSKIMKFAQIVQSIESTVLPQTEVNEIINRLNTLAVKSNIAEISSADPDKNSTIIPYYRNSRKQIFSVFENCPPELMAVQDLNLYLANAIGRGKVHRINYDAYRKSPTTNFVDIGNSEQIRKFVAEMVFLLRIATDINYEESTLKSYSDCTKLVLRIVQVINANSKDSLNISLKPEHHKQLQDIFVVKSDKLGYRALMQTIVLLCDHLAFKKEGQIAQRLRDIYAGKVNAAPVNRTATDVTNVEPLYIWSSVLSPREREEVNKKIGKDIFREQNKLFDLYRRKANLETVNNLHKLNKEIHDNLPAGFWSVLYGRLKEYHSYRKSDNYKKLLRSKLTSNRMIDTLKKSPNPQIPYREFVRDVVVKQSKLDLFCEETITCVITDYKKRSTEITDLCALVQWDDLLAQQYYNASDLSRSKSYNILLQEKNKGNPAAALLADAVMHKVRGKLPSDLQLGKTSHQVRQKDGKESLPTDGINKPEIIRLDGEKFLELKTVQDIRKFHSRLREKIAETGDSMRIFSRILDIIKYDDTETYEEFASVVNSNLQDMGVNVSLIFVDDESNEDSSSKKG